MNSPDKAGYQEAMKDELSTITKLKAWQVDPLTSDTTWACKFQRYPDGNIQKFKTIICCIGDQQVHGIDYSDTFAPLVFLDCS